MPSDSIVFNRAADFYDETRGFPPGVERAVAETLRQAGHLTHASQVLEIGIGTGRIALPLARHVRAVYGVDLARPMLDRLRAKKSGQRIEVAEADAAHLPFPADRFDAAIAVHVFHLMAAWQEAAHELARVLRPGAPLLHGWNQGGDSFRPLREAWEAAIPEDRRQEVGVRWGQRETFLVEQGWRVSGEHSLPYTYLQAPQTFLERIEGRVWSRTWQLSDEELAAGAAAVRAALRAHFPDPQRPVAVTAQFRVQVLVPPGN